MRRRDFIAGLLAAATERAHAQQPGKVYRIAVVYSAGSVDHWVKLRNLKGSPSWLFWEELGRLGFDDGQNLVVERYSGEGREKHFAELARDVVRSNPDLIYVNGTRMAVAFKAATTTIPIVASTFDPVANGLVPSLARPGGNITGVSSNAGPELSGKYLELLRNAIPGKPRLPSSPPRPSSIFSASIFSASNLSRARAFSNYRRRSDQNSRSIAGLRFFTLIQRLDRLA